MSDHPIPPLDVKALWKDQPREIAPVALETVRRDAKRLQRRRLRTVIIETLVAILAVIVYGFYIRVLPGLLLKIGSGFGILYVIFYTWCDFALLRPRRVPNDAAACLDFHRRELERQRDTARDMWRWAIVPMAPLIALMSIGRWIGPPPAGRAPWLDHLVIIASLVMVLETAALGWLWTQHRAARWQDQIDDLDALGRDAP